MAVDEAVGGVDHIAEVRDAISTEVDVVAFNLVVARLVVGRTGTKEETELRGGADVNFSTEEAGVEIAVHVGLAVIKRRPADDTRRPEASRAVGHFDLAAFTDARGLILDGAGERHAVHNARIARIEDEVVAQRVVGLGNVTLRSANQSIKESTGTRAFNSAGNSIPIGIGSISCEVDVFIARDAGRQLVVLDLKLRIEEGGVTKIRLDRGVIETGNLLSGQSTRLRFTHIGFLQHIVVNEDKATIFEVPVGLAVKTPTFMFQTFKVQPYADVTVRGRFGDTESSYTLEGSKTTDTID